jgi:ABC-type Na+ efflux pump permease subunit
MAVSDDAIRRAVGQVPVLTLSQRAADSDLQDEKNWLTAQDEGNRHLALIVIHPDAVVRPDAGVEFGSYDLYGSRGLDGATESALHESLRQAVVNARLKAGGLDQATVEATMRVPPPRSVIVSASGEQPSQRGFTRALPLILGVLMFVGIMIGGQGLMTSTVEEKSSRVVEVLLASVSPFELMAGKLLAQLGVGLLIVGVYIGLGMLALFQFAMFGLLDPMLVVYLVVFFVISYLVFGALMMAIGAAVNQVAEAQSLMGPVMMMLVLPYILTPMIGRAPNAPFSVAISFLPPFNTFTMLARLASDSPPPAWQVWLTVLVGLGAAYVAIWFAAKVFKVGLLMHGKPPNVTTLLRWAKAA